MAKKSTQASKKKTAPKKAAGKKTTSRGASNRTSADSMQASFRANFLRRGH